MNGILCGGVLTRTGGFLAAGLGRPSIISIMTRFLRVFVEASPMLWCFYGVSSSSPKTYHRQHFGRLPPAHRPFLCAFPSRRAVFMGPRAFGM